MSDTPTILLHLGAHKTGTTSLQHNFARHRAVLRQHGVRFLGPGKPYPHLYSAFLRDPMRYVWNRETGLSGEQILARDAAALAELDTVLAKNTDPWVVISNEFLALLPAPRLRLLRDYLAQYGPVRAVYTYRELHGWMSSNTQEMAKSGLATQPTPFEAALKRISLFPQRIRDVFGPDATQFLRFEDAAQSGICSLFLRSFGLPDFPTLGLTESRENVSISAPAVQALMAYNRAYPLGSAGRNAEEAARLKAMPGPKYSREGFTDDEISLYAQAHAAAEALGLRLVAPGLLPRRTAADPA